MMLNSLLSACLLSTAVTAAQPQPQGQEQTILKDTTQPKPLKIAIIGAGAGGSSTAYHLANYSSHASLHISITLFDRNPYIGGRSTTVNAYNSSTPSPSHAVELGASIFVSVNQILVDAVETFNLSTTDFNDNPKGIPGAALGIWDGNEFVLELEGAYGWWDTAKVLWKYGLQPIKTQRLMKSVVAKFLRMYEEPVFPFTDLTAAAQSVGLLAVTAATGEEYMRENGVSGNFGREVVQASTRVNYAQNLEYIHGLEAMVCMATDGAMGVQGGNWRIFEAMVNASGARVELGTEVRSIVKGGDGKGWVVSHSGVAGLDEHMEEFDQVVLATPYQFAGLDDSMQLFTHPSQHIPDVIPYVELHVTLFTSPHLLSPKFFNLATDKSAPQVILTTLPDGEPAQGGPKSVGKPGFFSISLLRPITNPSTNASEYLYKIFSAEPVDATFLSNLLDIAPNKHEEFEEASFSKRDISWIYRKIWNSYPYEYPRVTFEDIKLAEGFWYTSGMDSFISTMETNALMGRNVARLIVDEILRERDGRPSEA